MAEFEILKDIPLTIGILSLILTPLGLSASSAGQLAFTQNTNSTFSNLPPPTFEQLSAQHLRFFRPFYL